MFSNHTGLTRAADLVATTLEMRGSKVTRVDVWQTFMKPPVYLTSDCIHPDQCYDIDFTDVVFVATPGIPALEAFDQQWLRNRTVVGHWIWELEKLPQKWREEAPRYDEIWAATDLLTETFRSELPDFEGPIKTVPFAINQKPFKKIDPLHRSYVKKREQLDDARFVCGYSFSADSNYTRKNPEGAILAFRKAFPSQTDARLLLRCNDIGRWPECQRQLVAAISGDDRITLYDHRRSISIGDFYAALDTYISPSRAEGYGLNISEASQCGLSVIANGWRLAPEIALMPRIRTVDFDMIDVDDPQGAYTPAGPAQWAEPDIDQMASLLGSDYLTARSA